MLQRGELEAAQMEKDFSALLKFWRSVYQNKEKSV